MEFVEIRDIERFRRFMRDLAAGRMRRCVFESWEIDLLLDFSRCRPDKRRRAPLLEQYEVAVVDGIRRGLFRFPTISAFVSAQSGSRRRMLPIVPDCAPAPELVTI